MMDLQTVGFAAATYQRDMRLFEPAIHAVQAEKALASKQPIPQKAVPALTLNGLRYFFSDEVVAAVGFLSKLDAKKKAEVEANV